MTVVTKGDCPDAKQSKELIMLIDAILKKLTDVMQEYVQMVRTDEGKTQDGRSVDFDSPSKKRLKCT